MTISTGRRASDQAARAANDQSHITATPAPSRRRPASDRGAERAIGSGPASTAGSAAAVTSHAAAIADTRPVHRLDAAGLEPEFERLVERTVAGACASPGDQTDLTFGELGSIASFIHSARCHDGQMLQTGLALIAARHPDLTVLTRDVELPVTEAAQALIARNRPGELSGIRLGSEVFAREHYKADMVIVDEARRFAVVCDVKRSSASYNAARLGRLKAKLLACAVVAPDHLRTRHQIDGVRICHAAILDLSGHADLADGDVFGIDALDAFLAIEGAGAALHDLKRRFGQAVQGELVRRLRAAFPAVILPGHRRAGSGGRSGVALTDAVAFDAERACDLHGEHRDGADIATPDDASDEIDGTDEHDADDADLVDDADPSGRTRRRVPLTPSVSVALARPRAAATTAA